MTPDATTHGLCLASVYLLFGLLPVAADAAPDCQTIRFKAGASSTEIRGQAPATEEPQCLRFGAGEGQTVVLAIQSAHDQVAFTIDGLVDNQIRYRFKSKKQNYDLFVYQTARAAAPVSYVLSLSIK